MRYDWQNKHYEVISEFLKSLNQKTDDFVLKGGTSLMMCYGLDRFSEDIDLDGKRNTKSIDKIVKDFCEERDFFCRVAKDTDTVKRFMINYGNESKPLKIEISFRQRNIPSNNIDTINGITVYNINVLCKMKASAYQARDKIRDLYDIAFICNNYWEQLSQDAIDTLRNAVEYKGIDQFDYIVRTQSDELIDTDKLTEDFLKMYDKLDLLYTEEEKEVISERNLAVPKDDLSDDDGFNAKCDDMEQWTQDVIEKADDFENGTLESEKYK